MKLIGGIISGIGIFIAGASGLCSFFLIEFSRVDFSDLIAAVVWFGVIPFAVGMGMRSAGRAIVANAIAEAERNRSQQLVEPQVLAGDVTATNADNTTTSKQ